MFFLEHLRIPIATLMEFQSPYCTKSSTHLHAPAGQSISLATRAKTAYKSFTPHTLTTLCTPYGYCAAGT